MKLLIPSLIFYGLFLNLSESAKILAVFPAPSYSHFIIGDVLTKELAKRGHELTVIGPFKPKNSIENYKFIELTSTKEYVYERFKTIDVFHYQVTNSVFMGSAELTLGYDFIKLLYENENVQKLLKSNETYDLIIMEQFFGEAIYGLCYLFKAPCVAIVTMSSMSSSNRLTGNIGLASYAPHIFTKYSPKMSFLQRLNNLIFAIGQELLFHFDVVPKLNSLIKKHVPNSPHLYDIMYNNVSMVFLNSHPALSAPLPLTPNTKELGGIHIEGLKDVKLPNDVQTFLDNNKDVIYFAMGSNVQSKNIPPKILSEILIGLKKWGKYVLWKFEGVLPEKIDNVKVAKWFPQTAILAHKNVIAFITHCGRLSTLESLYYGVPMIGIPLFAEQHFNAAQMVYSGYAIALEFKTLKSTDLYNALIEISTNSKYRNEASIRSKALRMRNALDEAIYWIEHVIEFKGASYLKIAGVDLPWYQFWMVDVIGFLIVSISGISALVTYLVLKCFVCCQLQCKSSKNVSKTKKKN